MIYNDPLLNGMVIASTNWLTSGNGFVVCPMSGQAILVARKFWNEISHWIRDLFGFHARIIRGKNNLVETQLRCSTRAFGAFHPYVVLKEHVAKRVI